MAIPYAKAKTSKRIVTSTIKLDALSLVASEREFSKNSMLLLHQRAIKKWLWKNDSNIHTVLDGLHNFNKIVAYP